MKKKEPIGFDLVDVKPDYSKSLEEDAELDRKRYFEVYGEYPPEPEKELKELIRQAKKGKK